ncbi:hypothetical protein V5O48_004626 [Marasmius crinis-equi]|uniref:Uncharacterized protein n=1 Tax=Marasmius crinis-equi TaxID=585013 RepID=A0ABR3FPU2_9AGAR
MTIEEATQAPTVDPQDACKVLDEMSDSIASTRKAIEALRSKPSESLNTQDGISLLSLKHHVLLSYMHSLLLVSSRRVLGAEDGMKERSPPLKAFSDPERDERGAGMGDMVDQMLEGRLVLEKIKALEGRMKYQIEKLVKAAQGEKDTEGKDIVNDPLAFRPNPQNLANGDNEDDNEDDSGDEDEDEENENTPTDGIYRPPKIAPTPYLPQATTTAKSKKERERAGPIPTSLATILHNDGTTPHAESSSGLGGAPAFNMLSSRARHLKDLTEFEENQFGRVMMGKKEAKRRARDERDLALGGGLAGVGEEGKGGRRRGTAGGWEDEFGDVLRDVGRASQPGGVDAYDELRRKGKKAGALERSRDTQRKRKAVAFEDGGHGEGGDGKRKRSRFESERKNIKKKPRK